MIGHLDIDMLTSDSEMESAATPRWTLEGAANAIRASFFSKLHEGVAHESLRYADIRACIRETRHISDRTLSRALDSLVAAGKLHKREDGAYEPVFDFERKDAMELMLAADRMSIDAGASVGLVGSQDQGWTVYGIPQGKPRELRPKIRAAVEHFQGALDDILRTEAEDVVKRTLSKARSRGLTRRDAKSIERVLMQVFDFWETLRFEHLSSFAWVFIMERLAPGFLPQFLQRLFPPRLGIGDDLKQGLAPHESMAKRPQEWIPLISRLLVEDEESVRREWDRFVEEAKEGADNIRVLEEHLVAKDWKTFNKHWSSILAARYWLCAVVR
jgi:hypothetical protein